jgi:hypothetical protein
MFASRADLIVNLTFAATLAAPLLALLSFRVARRRGYTRHRNLQTGVLALCWSTVLAFELRLRIGGGAGALLRGSSPEWYPWARALLACHVTAAVITYLAWTWLAIVSWRRFRGQLPGTFSRRHRMVGRWIFRGLVFTALSATGMYTLGFVM